MRRCLVDQKPRKLTVEDYRVLNSCAEMVVCLRALPVVAVDVLGCINGSADLPEPVGLRSTQVAESSCMASAAYVMPDIPDSCSIAIYSDSSILLCY